MQDGFGSQSRPLLNLFPRPLSEGLYILPTIGEPAAIEQVGDTQLQSLSLSNIRPLLVKRRFERRRATTIG